MPPNSTKQHILKSFSLVRKHTLLSAPSRKPEQSSAGRSVWAVSFWWRFLRPACLCPPSDGLNCSSLCDCSEVSFDPSTVLSAVFGTWELSSDQGSTQLFFPKPFSDHMRWAAFFFFFRLFFFLFFLQVVSGFGGPQKLVCRKEFGRCETSLCFFRSVSHCCLHGSDTLFVWQCT